MNEEKSAYPDMKPWQYDKPPTLLDFAQNNMFSNSVRIVIHLFLRIWLAFFNRLEIINGPVTKELSSTIIAANHASHLDVLVIQSAFPLLRINRVRSLAAKDYFFNNPLVRLATFFIANTIPLGRGAYDSASFGFSKECLREDANIILFPEGTRTINGEMQNFKPGIGIMALNTNVRILPVYIKGTYQSMEKGKFIPRPKPVTVVFGEPVAYTQLQNTRESWQYIAQDVESRVKALKSMIEKA